MSRDTLIGTAMFAAVAFAFLAAGILTALGDAMGQMLTPLFHLAGAM